MLSKFIDIEELSVEHLHGGEGIVLVKSVDYEDGSQARLFRLPVGASIGVHTHDDANTLCYILAGSGIAVCDGRLEKLAAGSVHYCPCGSKHSVANTEGKELKLLCLISKVSIMDPADVSKPEPFQPDEDFLEDSATALECEAAPAPESSSVPASEPVSAPAAEADSAPAPTVAPAPVPVIAPYASVVHARLLCGLDELGPDQTVDSYKQFIDKLSQEPWMHTLSTADSRAAYAKAWKEYWSVISQGDASAYGSWIEAARNLAR